MRIHARGVVFGPWLSVRPSARHCLAILFFGPSRTDTERIRDSPGEHGRYYLTQALEPSLPVNLVGETALVCASVSIRVCPPRLDESKNGVSAVR